MLTIELSDTHSSKADTSAAHTHGGCCPVSSHYWLLWQLTSLRDFVDPDTRSYLVVSSIHRRVKQQRTKVATTSWRACFPSAFLWATRFKRPSTFGPLSKAEPPLPCRKNRTATSPDTFASSPSVYICTGSPAIGTVSLEMVAIVTASSSGPTQSDLSDPVDEDGQATAYKTEYGAID